MDFRPGHPGYKKIALFDSGVGGLSVLRRLKAALPAVEYIYLGDTARLPYGNRSRAEISAFVQEIISFLSAFEPDAVVMACNTSAALAYDVALQCACELSSASGRGLEVFNLIEPMAGFIAAGTYRRAGVMATQATVNSRAFGLALEALNFDGSVVEVACPRLVPLIESGRLGEDDIEAALASALTEYLIALAGCDAIVLGCTHFPFLRGRIEALISGPLAEYFSNPVVLLDPAEVLAEYIAALCAAPDMVTPALPAQEVQVFTTGGQLEFKRSAELCLGAPVGLVARVDLAANVPQAMLNRVSGAPRV
ncbi:MAG: glutamate racemase [Cyanobacteria bacterium SZAS TMP-1]|nr:glutamate racemase [Cyanobacteria bacterium SZAS TMP-1]